MKDTNVDQNVNPKKLIPRPLLPALQQYTLYIVKRLVVRADSQTNLHHRQAEKNLTVFYAVINM